jgi:NhaA family Na+:H+ antiporter
VLPIGAAIGGMVVPAFIFALFNKGTIFQNGWGIPTATDIAFSLGVASLIGKKFPINLKIFLTAVAIIDDLGAIFIIAFFYGGQIAVWYLLGAALVVLVLAWLNKKKAEFGLVQIALGILLWFLVFNSGLHATIGGVIFAFLIPSHLLPSLEQKFHSVVNFFILPLFAFANTAIVINGGLLGEINSTLTWGITAGLVVGKPLGIYFASRLLISQNWAVLPRGISWSQMAGAGILAGIGFTMSIFIASLAFGKSSNTDISKIAILLSVVISVLAGLAWFKWISKPKPVT